MGTNVFVPDPKRTTSPYEAPLYEEHAQSQFENRLFQSICFVMWLLATLFMSLFGWKVAAGAGLIFGVMTFAAAADDKRKCRSTVLRITTREVQFSKGHHTKTVTVLRVEDIRDVKFSQDPYQKRRGVGDIQISTSGQAGAEIEVKEIPAPDRISHLISQLRSRS